MTRPEEKSYLLKTAFPPRETPMSLFLYVIIPLGYALTGQLVGTAAAASWFYTDAGKRRGKVISRWCAWLFPVVFVILIAAGAAGNAGREFTLFGSAAFFDTACGIPLYAVPILAAYAGLLYVIRDLMWGDEAKSSTTNYSNSAAKPAWRK
jgi:hypothetical protein